LSNRIDRSFASARRQNVGALLPYITAGYPNPETTAAILQDLDRPGVTAVELGIPFSDSIADGPVIQTSFTRALDRGLKIDRILEMVAAIRSHISLPVLAMVSFTIVHRRGTADFLQSLAQAGFDGLIVPDLALEEAPQLAEETRKSGLRHVMMVAPTSSPQRTERIAGLSTGFLYYQAVVGITGERSQLPDDLPVHINQLRSVCQCPIAVGFGISTPDHVRQVCAVADGAIVGSAIVRRINDAVDAGRSASQIVRGVSDFVEELLTGTR
jgi:tryptophan synthase alpha chain